MDTDRRMVDAGLAPFTEQIDQTVAPGLKHISSAQLFAGKVRVFVQVDPFVGDVGTETLVWNMTAPGTDLLRKSPRALDVLR
ncbi:hypothetical protein D3C77_169620 [compost metagenome]